MKNIALLALIVALVLLPSEQGRAQSDSHRGEIVFAQWLGVRVTVSRDGINVTSFEVPDGNFLRVTYTAAGEITQRSPLFTQGRFEFHGNAIFRLETKQPINGQPNGKPALNLTVTDADVLILLGGTP